MARTGQALRRVEAAARRTDTRGWVVQRRERTRHLIELGGLVQKAGLADLADDDRATLYGALLACAARARGDDAGDVLAPWKLRGKRAFEAEAVSPERLDTDACRCFGLVIGKAPGRERVGQDDGM